MRNWQTIGGAAVWMALATLMASAALQPVQVSAATAGGGISFALCDDGSPSLAMGCASIHL